MTAAVVAHKALLGRACGSSGENQTAIANRDISDPYLFHPLARRRQVDRLMEVAGEMALASGPCRIGDARHVYPTIEQVRSIWRASIYRCGGIPVVLQKLEQG